MIDTRLSTALEERYRIERPLGAGGMATVYLATDLKHEREVALKVLRPELGAVLGGERFLAEIKITARLDHPHILTLIDSGEAGGFLYYILPYVRGESLRDKLNREHQLGIEEAVAITRQVASALDYAHRQGVIHRDIKPENILLQEGEAMLTDFGIALAVREAGGNRLTESGLSLGTPQYMSPEQATGDRQLDARSDLYSLAAVLYEMLAGEPPVTGPNAQAMIAKLMTERPTRLRVVRESVPVSIDAAVSRALDKTPADRFASAGDFARALEIKPVAATAPVVVTVGPRRRVVVLVVLGVLLGMVVFLIRRTRAGEAQAVSLVPVQLTTSGRAELPVISPDGSQVGYAQEVCTTPAACTYSLVVRETATSSERVLVSGLFDVFPFQWSRDGLWMLYNGAPLGQPDGIYAVARLGGTPQLISRSVANFLPLGDTIVAARSDSAGGSPGWFQLLPPPWTQATDSFPARAPAPGAFPSAIRAPAHGSRIAVGWSGTAGEWITLQDRMGRMSDSVRVPNPQYLRWSGHDRVILIPIHLAARQESALLRIQVDERSGRFGRRDTLTLAGGTSQGSVYDLSEDGHSLVYSATRQGESSVWAVTRTKDRFGEGRQLARSSRPLGVYITEDGKVVLVSEATAIDSALTWSWWATPFDSLVKRPITPPTSREAWSVVDGNEFLQGVRQGDSSIRVTRYPLGAGAPRASARIPGQRMHILPGPGGRILALDATGDTLRMFDSTSAVLWRTPAPGPLGKFAVLLPSPDRSAYLAIVLPASRQVGADGNVALELDRVDAQNGALTRLPTLRALEFRGYVWGRDGWIYAMLATAADPAYKLYRFRPDGSGLAPVGQIPFADDGDCEMSADARRWACTRIERLSDIYLVRNFQAVR